MTEVIISSIACIIILVVLLFGISFSRRFKVTKTTSTLTGLIHCVIFYICVYVIGIALEHHKIVTGAFIFNFLLFLCIDLTIVAFGRFLQELIKESGNYRAKFLYTLILITTSLRIIAIIVLTFTNNLFYIDAETGKYMEYSLSWIPYVFSGITLLEFILLVLANRKTLPLRQTIVICIYILFPLIPTFVELFANAYSVTGIGLTVSLVMIYVLIKDIDIENNAMHESLLEELSRKDFLTSLSNRRSYDEYLNNINKETYAGVIFCDMNGLKYINDNFGHKAGDERIVFFSKILIDAVGIDNIFRISGDEFVIIMANITEDDFNLRVSLLKEQIKLNDNISALGISYGKTSNIDKLISNAETNMYSDKKTSHKKRN